MVQRAAREHRFLIWERWTVTFHAVISCSFHSSNINSPVNYWSLAAAAATASNKISHTAGWKVQWPRFMLSQKGNRPLVLTAHARWTRYTQLGQCFNYTWLHASHFILNYYSISCVNSQPHLHWGACLSVKEKHSSLLILSTDDQSITSKPQLDFYSIPQQIHIVEFSIKCQIHFKNIFIAQ